MYAYKCTYAMFIFAMTKKSVYIYLEILRNTFRCLLITLSVISWQLQINKKNQVIGVDRFIP